MLHQRAGRREWIKKGSSGEWEEAEDLIEEAKQQAFDIDLEEGWQKYLDEIEAEEEKEETEIWKSSSEEELFGSHMELDGDNGQGVGPVS